MVQEGLPGAAEQTGKFCPGLRPASLARAAGGRSEPPMKYRRSAGLILIGRGFVVDCCAGVSGFGA